MTTLNEGETLQVPGSGSAVHTIKRSGGVYSCSCPAWRNQSLPIDVRNCKHLVKMGLTNVPSATPAPVAAVPLVQPPPVLLAQSWDTEQDLVGWWMSEKLDGVRGWWDGTRFISRQGNTFHAPKSFTKNLPSVVLDGELWMGRKLFQKTVGAVKKFNPDPSEWAEIKFMIFDAPTHGGVYEDRMTWLRNHLAWMRDHLSGIDHIELVTNICCEGIDHIRDALKGVQSLGGEGLMLRAPRSLYEAGRSNTLLKVKEFFDAEGIVTGYEPGKGKHKGRVGALHVTDGSDRYFKVGTGLSDSERKSPPPIGSKITYRYQELTDDGMPRFPVYVCCRDYE